MLQIKDLNIGYKNRRLLKDATINFTNGRITALIGRNGTGKSTLLRTLAGLTTGHSQQYTGEVLLEGHNISGMKPDELAKRLAFVATERIRISNLKCRDVVAMGRAPYTDWIGRMSDMDEEMVNNALRLTGMESFANRTMDKMSDGECQRIMIARALAQDTPNILLDEPTSFLDLPTRYELTELLASLAHAENKMILFSTHELDIAINRCDNVALLADQTLYLLPAREEATENFIKEKFGLKSFAMH